MQNGARHSGERATRLLRVALLVFGGQLFVLHVLHFLFASGGSVFADLWYSRDFACFYNGARAWLAGRDPYHEFGFITPPLSLLLPALLTHLSLARATLCFLCCNLVLVPLSLWWYAGTLGMRRREKILLMLASALFVSAEESVRGGNMDGLMLVLMIAALGMRRRLAGVPFLAFSIGLKLYSIILLPVALRRRQWRFASLTAGVLVAFLLPFFRLWPAALHALVGRDGRYLPTSIAPATLIYSFWGEMSRARMELCLLFWAVTFCIALYRDHERELSAQTLARYVPWMISVPALVWSYVGVLALAVFASLVATARRRRLHWGEYCCFAGFLLLGIHMAQVTNYIPLAYDFRDHAAVVQSFGVVLMMLGTCLTPGGEADEGETRDERGKDAAVAGHPLPDRRGQEIPLA